MPVIKYRHATQIARSSNPKVDIINAIGDVSQIEVLGDQVLIGIYFRPEKTAGGIIRPDANVEEDEFQGKVGLVVKKGHIAYAEWEDHPDVQGIHAKIGDWVVVDAKSGLALSVNGYPCRLIQYKYIRMNIPDPTMVV